MIQGYTWYTNYHLNYICNVEAYVIHICITIEVTHHPYIRSVCDVSPQHNKNCNKLKTIIELFVFLNTFVRVFVGVLCRTYLIGSSPSVRMSVSKNSAYSNVDKCYICYYNRTLLVRHTLHVIVDNLSIKITPYISLLDILEHYCNY